MGASIQSQGMNVPQQPQGQGKGGGGRSMFNVPQQQLMNTPFFAGLQAAEQRMAQDPNANMMGTQPALPAGYDPNVPQRGFGVMVQPSQAPSQIPAGMQGDQLRMQQDQQMSMDALNQARQAGFQVGPTPNQPPNPLQQQQMMELMRQRQPMPPQMGNPMFGGLGGMPVPPAAAFSQSPIFGGRNPAQSLFGRMGRSGKGGGFSQAQNPNRARLMGRGLGGLTGFFR